MARRGEEARVQLQKAVVRMGADPTIHDHLGDVEAAFGNAGAAVGHWRRALELGGDGTDAIQEKIRQHQEAE